MPTFYHGSSGLFTKPDPSLIKEEMGLGTNEYGWGFYMADHGSDSWEYIQGTIASKKPAFIYGMDIDDEIFESEFLVSHENISPEKLQRIIDVLDDAKIRGLAEKYRNKMDETLATRDVYYDVVYNGGLKPREASDLFVKAGFQGYLEGSYLVMFSPQNLPDFHIAQAYNYSRDEHADYALLQRIAKGGKLADYANEKFEGRVNTLEIRSEMARAGLSTMMHENVPISTIELYLDLIELSEQSKDNGGFDLRDKLGHTVCRAFMVHPSRKEDAYFGTNLTNVEETFDYWYPDTKAIEGFTEKLSKFVEELKDHPKVHYVVANAPQKKSENKM